jgi:hypothetical protein
VNVAALWRRGQEGWPRSFPIVQFPNAPLLVAIGGWGLAAAGDGDVRDVGQAIGAVGLAAFAWLEAADGDNWLRRLLGVGVLAGLVVRLAARA